LLSNDAAHRHPDESDMPPLSPTLRPILGSILRASLLLTAALAVGGLVLAQEGEPGAAPTTPQNEAAAGAPLPTAAPSGDQPGEPSSAGEEPTIPEPTIPEPDHAADFFLSRCAGCHTIGDGVLTGPDLEPSTHWPAGDLAKAVQRMEKNVGPMSDEQVAQLVELLRDADVKQRLSRARERQVEEMAATLEPASPSRGRDLFHGAAPLRNGGVACAACHRAEQGGGTLAVALDDAAEKLGEQALASAAETPGFPLMRAAYGERPVTRQEALHLAAYLAQVSRQASDSPVAARAASSARVGSWGTAGAVLFLLAMAVLYRGRLRGVRAPLVRQARRR
jgi:mono/diheme cytochrome c family protein